MKTMSKHIFYPIIERVANGSTFSCFKLLQRTQWLPPEELRRLQEQQLRALVTYAYENVPYYRRLFEDRGIDLDGIKSIQDLGKLPVLTRQIIRDNSSSLVAQNYKGRVKSHSTGGTTGEPLKLYKPKDEGWSWGAYYRGLSWYGFEPGDKQARIWGGLSHGSLAHRMMSKAASFLERETSLSAFDLSERKMSQFANKLKGFQPTIIIGYSSGLYIFAEYLRHRGIQDIKPKAVITSAEKLFEHQRQSIRETFGCDVFEWYGCGEVLSIAYECPEHQGLHISTEKVILEVIREDGSACKSGERGRIVVTDLWNYAMPFIRYENGDVGTLSDEDCSCGRSLPLLKCVEGRITDIISMKDRYISAPVLTTIFKNLPVRQYQVIQEAEEKILIKVVKAGEYSDQDTKYILKTMRQHTGVAVEIEIKFVDDIPPSASSGKRRVVISHVPPKLI